MHQRRYDLDWLRIIAFAVLGKLSDSILALAVAPLLRWEDAFGARR